MTKDFNYLFENGTWELMIFLIGKNATTCKWMFNVKLKIDGFIERYKVCLISKGYLEVKWLNYGKTLSPIIKPTII